MEENAIGVMAVDNLPCELPKDASTEFGKMFIEHVLEPLTGNDPEEIIGRATETINGELTPHFDYLQDYLEGKGLNIFQIGYCLCRVICLENKASCHQYICPTVD